MTTKPSPGALRAAELLEVLIDCESTVKIAEIIDLEMGVPELIAALEEIFYMLSCDEEITIEELYLMIYNVRKHCLATIRKTTSETMPLKKTEATKTEPPTQDKKGD